LFRWHIINSSITQNPQKNCKYSEYLNIVLLFINTNECAQFPLHDFIIYNYFIDNQYLESASSVKDLGIMLSPNLSFFEYISSICNKTIACYGWLDVYFMISKIYNVLKVKTLYCSLVRLNLKKGSMIWNPSQLNQMNSLNKVQSYFLRYYILSYEIALNYLTKETASKLDLHILLERRIFNDVSFIFNILNNNIHCPKITLGLKSFFMRPTLNHIVIN